jgi:hypothetical protein
MEGRLLGPGVSEVTRRNPRGGPQLLTPHWRRLPRSLPPALHTVTTPSLGNRPRKAWSPTPTKLCLPVVNKRDWIYPACWFPFPSKPVEALPEWSSKSAEHRYRLKTLEKEQRRARRAASSFGGVDCILIQRTRQNLQRHEPLTWSKPDKGSVKDGVPIITAMGVLTDVGKEEGAGWESASPVLSSQNGILAKKNSSQGRLR